MLKGSKISMLIEGLNISKSKFYEEIGISKATMYNIVNELSSPSAENLEKIADYFKIPIDSLFERNVEIPGNYIGHHINGNGNQVTGDIALSECQKEIIHLKELLAEKERTINILLGQHSKQE